MKTKVVYISIILLLTLLNSGYSQKVSLILLPSGSTGIQTYDIQTEKNVPLEKEEEIKYTRETVQLAPEKSKSRKNSRIKEQRICKIIGSFCEKKWSAEIIKLFSLPSTSGIKI